MPTRKHDAKMSRDVNTVGLAKLGHEPPRP